MTGPESYEISEKGLVLVHPFARSFAEAYISIRTPGGPHRVRTQKDGRSGTGGKRAFALTPRVLNLSGRLG